MKESEIDLIIKRILMTFKDIRLRKGYAQRDMVQDMGITFQQYQKYETGKNRVSLKNFIQICNILDIDGAKVLRHCIDATSNDHTQS